MLGTVDRIIDSYGARQEALVQILLDIQHELRWLPRPVLERVAARLELPLNLIYNVTTFYKHFSLVPQGRHSISVCVGTACHVRGASRLLGRVSEALGIKPDETTADEKFTLKTVSCLGCCALGPVMVLDGEYMSNPNSTDIAELIEKCE
ncbi:MAG: NAD(P)H-dependent oxidoreductase subunit E [Deltaproteobacteria bacterium]|jgi:NADH-quinone oxidoreductase subunit E|nr:NAD(P)H-dependent oxidoreductase subunit E [Deltaproteobacteria bacterium]